VLQDYQYPYVLISPGQIGHPTNPALIINVQTNRVLIPEHLAYGYVSTTCCHFSRDSRTLYYVSWEPPSETATLRAFGLKTATDRAVASLNLPVESDLYGEHWLYQDTVSGWHEYVLLSEDGTKSILAKQNADADDFVLWSFFGSFLFSSVPKCTINCTVQLQVVGGDSHQFSLPPHTVDTSLFPIYKIDNGNMIFMSSFPTSETNVGYEYWYLGTDGSVLPIGFNDYADEYIDPSRGFLYTNRRWILAFNAPAASKTYGVWDISSKSYVLTVPIGDTKPALDVRFGKDAFLIIDHNATPNTALLYRDKVGKAVELPHTEAGDYFELLPDATLLYQKKTNDGTGEIYHYDPGSDRMTLIARKANPIGLYSLEWLKQLKEQS
jgi:hypothetical protein